MKTTYICNCCGKELEGWPALVFNEPVFYNLLTDEEKKQIAKISNDLCVIAHDDQTDRFIRCTLTQKVNDHCQNLEYGLWVSLSEKSFNDYVENFDNKTHITQYFGWISNNIPGYEETTKVPAKVLTRSGNNRPEIVPHDDHEHPFVRDYYDGISKEEAERRIEDMYRNMASKD